MDIILELKNISKNYGRGEDLVQILQGIDFSIQSGEVVAIIGASGSGKTTFLQIASLLDSATSGVVSYLGEEVVDSLLTRKKYTSFVYQLHNLMPEFTVLENAKIAANVKGLGFLQSEAEDVFAKLGLEGKTHRKPAELSSGECQRASIARALLCKPKIIFADEPTGNLDPHNASMTINLMLSAIRSANAACIIVTHNHEIAAMADVTYEIKETKLIRR